MLCWLQFLNKPLGDAKRLELNTMEENQGEDFYLLKLSKSEIGIDLREGLV